MIRNLPQFDIKRQTVLISNCKDKDRAFHFLQIKLDKTKKNKHKNKLFFRRNLRQFDIICPNDLSPNRRIYLREFVLCISKSKISFAFGRNKMIPNLPQFDIKRLTVLISNCRANSKSFHFLKIKLDKTKKKHKKQTLISQKSSPV